MKAREIIDMTASSRPSQGADSARALPLRLSLSASEGCREAPDRRKAAPELTLSPRLRAAVVDDDPLICELLQESLREIGYETASFARPLDALAAVRAMPFDVIVCDIKMPGVTGLDFHARVQALDSGQAARMLFLSGDLTAPATQAFLEETGSLSLCKPFRQAQLKAKLNEVHQRAALRPDQDSVSEAVLSLESAYAPQRPPADFVAPVGLPKAA